MVDEWVKEHGPFLSEEDISQVRSHTVWICDFPVTDYICEDEDTMEDDIIFEIERETLKRDLLLTN